jgi:tetratricopeptide (TPR) repeat protein
MSIYVFDVRLWSLAATTKQNIIAIRKNFNIAVVEAALNQSTPHIDSVRSDIAQAAVPFLLEDIHHFDQTALARTFPLLEQAVLANHELHPFDLRNDLLLVRLMQIGYDISGDAAYLDRAEHYLAAAFERNPRRQQILFDWSVFKAARGQWAAAEQLIRQGITLNPQAGEGYSRLATIFSLQKKTSAAQALRAEVEKNHAQFLEEDQAIFEAALGNN